jgi:hypothetical protein
MSLSGESRGASSGERRAEYPARSSETGVVSLSSTSDSRRVMGFDKAGEAG